MTASRVQNFVITEDVAEDEEVRSVQVPEDEVWYVERAEFVTTDAWSAELGAQVGTITEFNYDKFKDGVIEGIVAVVENVFVADAFDDFADNSRGEPIDQYAYSGERILIFPNNGDASGGETEMSIKCRRVA